MTKVVYSAIASLAGTWNMVKGQLDMPVCGGVTGEEFLRQWAAEVVADGDLDWWPRFSAIVAALDIVDAIDIDVARGIGQSIRNGLTAKTGAPTLDFYLGSRHFEPRPHRGPITPPPTAPPEVSVRSAPAALPAAVGLGATQFVAVEADQAWLVCGGPGLAPWDGSERGAPSPPFLGVEAVVDDHGRLYQLTFRASSAPARGEPRQRWSLKTGIEPIPGHDVKWLELLTAHGPVLAHLHPPVPTTVATTALGPLTEIEYHLDSQLHRQVWLHLLDPGRARPPVATVVQALTDVAAIDPAHPLALSLRAADDALAGKPLSPELPKAVAAALRPPVSTPWLGTEALLASVQLDGVFMALEAVIGHQDRFELYFIEPPMPFPPGSHAMVAHQLIVWATDNRGGGYIGSAEGGPGEGLYHFRPPLDSNVELLTVHLDGPAHGTTVDISLSRDST